MPDDALITRLQTDMKAAMKAKDKPRLDAIRMLVAEANNADLQKPPSTPQKMVEAHHKRLKKSRDEYQKLGKADEVAALDREIAVAEEYVPRQASAEETHRLVDEFLASQPDYGPGDVGRATGAFMKTHQGTADAAAANARIREVLSGR